VGRPGRAVTEGYRLTDSKRIYGDMCLVARRSAGNGLGDLASVFELSDTGVLVVAVASANVG
jgi:hypothetical protein